MSVKNILPYHSFSIEQLDKLNTKHLIHVLQSARGRIICSCGKSHHCGDDVLDFEEQEFNLNQKILFDKVKSILNTREHIPRSTKQVKVKEKKNLKY